MKIFAALLCFFAVCLPFVPSALGQINWSTLTAVVDEAPGNFTGIEDVFFTLYTRESPQGQLIDWQNFAFSLGETSFNNNNPIRVLIHGWNGNVSSESEVLIKDAYLQKGAFNVINVDWSKGAITANYFTAKDRVEEVGYVISDFLQYLEVYGGIQRRNVYIIGHSLGGHIAGFAGKKLQEDGEGKVNAIVALDPAEPGYTGCEAVKRLNTPDATNVVVIKTSALGSAIPLGRSYFCPNSGVTQPGCDNDIACSHGRSYRYFAESITAKTQKKATGCGIMFAMPESFCWGTKYVFGGEPLDMTISGNYAMTTKSAAPYLA